LPLSLRKRAMVLKSTVRRPVSQFDVAPCVMFEPATVLNAVEVIVDLYLEDHRGMVRRAALERRFDTPETLSSEWPLRLTQRASRGTVSCRIGTTHGGTAQCIDVSRRARPGGQYAGKSRGELRELSPTCRTCAKKGKPQRLRDDVTLPRQAV